MARRPALTAAKIASMVRGALDGGMLPGSFKIVHRDGELSLLPADAVGPPSVEEDLERRMRDAFGA